MPSAEYYRKHRQRLLAINLQYRSTPKARAARRARDQRRRAENPAFFRLRNQQYYQRNKTRRQAQFQRWYRENKLKNIAKAKAWAAANRDKNRANQRNWRDANRSTVRGYGARGTSTLTDNYVKTVLQLRRRISRENLPPALVEAKRVHLQVLRKLKELRK